MHWWEPLNDNELGKIHESACHMIEEQGMRIGHPEAVNILLKAGARKIKQDVLCFPRDLVERSIESAPATFRVYDRSGGSLEIGGKKHYHLIGGTMTEVLEYPGWNRRPATLEDVANLVRIVDALDCVHMAIPTVEAQDVPKAHCEILSCAEMFKNTTKFCYVCPVEEKAYHVSLEIAKALAGTNDLSQKPTLGFFITLQPTYAIEKGPLNALMLGAREGIPMTLMAMPIAGMQGPATMAGSLVMRTADILAAICLAQSIRPGSPCLMDCSSFKLDMRYAEFEMFGPEILLGVGAGAQLSRRYGIPSYCTCPATDSKIPDFQAGLEMGASWNAALLAGINVTVNAGTISKASASSYETLILLNEILRTLLRATKGIEVDRETLALDVQKEIGIRGDYLGHPHTLKHVRSPKEFLHKDLFDVTSIRTPYEDICAKAHKRSKKILKEHQVKVSEDDKKMIDEVVKRFTNEWERY